MNDMGDYMFPIYRRRWIEDTPALRNSIIQTLQNWAPFSNSSQLKASARRLAPTMIPTNASAFMCLAMTILATLLRMSSEP